MPSYLNQQPITPLTPLYDDPRTTTRVSSQCGLYTPESPGGTEGPRALRPLLTQSGHLEPASICPPTVSLPSVAMLCSCYDDKTILNWSTNTWRPTRFKWRPPSLIANKLLIGLPFIDPSLWIKEVKVVIKPQCFSLVKYRKKRLKARYSSWVCCQSQLRAITAEKMMKQVALKCLTDLYKATRPLPPPAC